MRSRKYLPTGSGHWSRGRGGIFAKLTSSLKKILRPFFRVIYFFVSKLYKLIFGILGKLPLFRSFIRHGRRSPLYWLNVFATTFLVFLIFSSVAFGAVAIIFSKDLPSPDRLVDREVSLSTKIYDRNGTLLYDIYGDENRTLVKIDQVPEIVKQATIAIEDKHFYTHQGFDPIGMARGIYNTIVKRELQGGSSITQQLVKNTLLTTERTIVRKVKEFILALQIEARYSKDEILQMYLNETPYGGQAIGIQAAAENYFGKNVGDLNLAEATLLAGLPQAPSRYSPYRDPELAKWRQGEVLRRMREDGYITRDQEESTKSTKLKYRPEGVQIKAPHFVMYVRELLADRYGETFVETGGLKVTTTLDLKWHNKFQKIVTDEIARDRGFKVSNGALIAINPKTGEILSMVGSKNYFATDIDGQFNVTTSPSRQPGSSIKPLMYATAFKQGFSPATKLVGVPTSFDMAAGQPPYKPQNFANRNYGIISVRKAIGNSLNIPAVKMLSLIGVDNLIATAHDMGITTLTDPTRYGVALTLGGGEVKMIDMATAFSVFATGGIRHDPVAILKVTDSNGNVLEEFKPNKGVRALSEQVAYLINNIVSDFNARLQTFGGGSQLGLNIPGHTVGVKTGTTNDNRDNWAIGFTPAHSDSKVAITIAAWIGNNDNSPMNPNFFAGSARIWNQAMVAYLSGKPNVAFKRPDGIVSGTVDALSGMAPGSYTAGTETDIFIAGTVPTETDNWHVRLDICKPDGKLASEACIAAGQSEERNYIQIRAEKPEWQDDVDAWVAKVYKGKSQYFPPKTTSTLCFSGGSVVSCTDPGAGPIITEADVSFRQYPSGPTELDRNSLPSSFAVWVTPTPQPGAEIAFVQFSLSGADCIAENPNECNKSVSGGTIENWLVTTSTCGEGCYSSKDNGPIGTALPLFQMANQDLCIPGPYTLKIEVQDKKGGSSTLEIPITLACT
ncbi:hypothetical protein A2V54_01170 [candidate division WWE3 bacterium RBG_19FT_COMBO_53_11]|uniref:Uncharacterized protein n=1 Tax=candidate division WWE3 bacterium RBG_19FT_COMBO_53_11 TaxID=1802613 RepID=A0A1F4UHS1_UNCKA|nr:MAG: hypothetical protein A2V54_01170 [candidate division WWE3 bacterium RBG_19FT_COMBO_53_11]